MMTTRKKEINRYIGAKLKSARNNKYIMGCLTDVFLWIIERGINSNFENPNCFYRWRCRGIIYRLFGISLSGFHGYEFILPQLYTVFTGIHEGENVFIPMNQ